MKKALIVVGLVVVALVASRFLTETPESQAVIETPPPVLPELNIEKKPHPELSEIVSDEVELPVEFSAQPKAEPAPEEVVPPVVEEVPEYVAPQPAFVKYVAPVVEMTADLHKPGKTVQNDLDVLESLFSYYHSVFKTMPSVGLNVEYVDHLVGMNAKGVQILPHDHPSINEKGELMDRWGTPYFFHPMSDREVEITSAGPDRTLFTEDDVQLH